MPHKPDPLERISRAMTLIAFAVAVLVFFLAPVWALSWRQLPFPGFLLEHTLVVNNRTGHGWSGREAGIERPMAMTRVASASVSDGAGFREALRARSVGDAIPLFVRFPNGALQLFPSIELTSFPASDFNRMFWLPYVIGLAYFSIGAWIYLARGSTRPGRALAFFCICVSLTMGLLFDILTTHLATALWIIALAHLGGALISLSLRFPEEWKPVESLPWILAAPYVLSIALGGWALLQLYNTEDPWAYLAARSIIYRFTAATCLVFFFVMLVRSRSASGSNVRRQARIVLLGALLAFTPTVVWFSAPIAGYDIPFNSTLFLPGLLLFPVSVAVAILRYRLLEVDAFINRAIFYGAFTAILAGVFAASISLSQRLFVLLTGERSDASIVLTTLIVASAATPIKNQIQAWMDRNLREQPAAALQAFGAQIQSYLLLSDPDLLTERYLVEAATALGADSGAVIRGENGDQRIAHIHGPWRGNALVSVPLQHGDQRYGRLVLGPRKDGRPYRHGEVEFLARVSGLVAHAIQVSHEESASADSASEGN